MDRKDPVGMCYSTRSDFTHVRAHKPCVESGRVSFRGRIRPTTILIVLFFSFPSLRVRIKNRHARLVTSGIRAITSGGSPLELVSQQKMSLAKYLSTRLVRQVSLGEVSSKNWLKLPEAKAWALELLILYSPLERLYFLNPQSFFLLKGIHNRPWLVTRVIAS